MPRTPNTHGGGALTNANGLRFEQTTSLDNALQNNGYIISESGEVYADNTLIGYTKAKHKFRKFLEAHGVDLSVNSDVLLPDDAFINIRNTTVYIVEKKFQSASGSVAEKIQTCEYKKLQYTKLISQMGYNTVYVYLLSDFFNDSKFSDVLNFINSKGCYYYFNELPLDFLGLWKEYYHGWTSNEFHSYCSRR